MKVLNAAVVSSWVLQLVVAAILLQTLFFKFTGAPESVYIFSTLGAEPWGRIGSGVVELVAAILVLVPATTTIGAALAMGVMAGAIMSHLTCSGSRSAETAACFSGSRSPSSWPAASSSCSAAGRSRSSASGCARTRSRSGFEPLLHSGVAPWPLPLPSNPSSACWFRCGR